MQSSRRFLAVWGVVHKAFNLIILLTDHAALDLKARQQTEEADVAAELIRKCVAENATT